MDTITIVLDKEQIKNIIVTSGVTAGAGFNTCMVVANQYFHAQMVKEAAEALNKESKNDDVAVEPVGEEADVPVDNEPS